MTLRLSGLGPLGTEIGTKANVYEEASTTIVICAVFQGPLSELLEKN